MRSWKLIAATTAGLAAATTALVSSSAAPDRQPARRARLQRAADVTKPKQRVPNGYVLTHEHPTNTMAFGGNYAFTGAPGNYRNGIMERGYTAPCSGCQHLSACDHGEFKGFFSEAAVGGDIGDHKAHKGPLHDAFSHARYSTEWIREAWKPSEPELQNTRMRIFVAYAVENEAMCEQLYYVNKGKGGPGGDGYPCSHGDSLASLERQLDALKAWAKENASWMEIAYNATDARRIANADKLVVILGIEAEYAFGAEDRTFDPVERLNRYYDDGVRTFYLAHKINSRLAGADVYWPGFTKEGKAIRATQAISGCFYFDDAVAPFPLRNDEGQRFCDNNCGKGYFKGFKAGGLLDNCASKLSEISEANMADYVLLRGDNTFDGFKIYPVPPGFKGPGGTHVDNRNIERNLLGLSNDGERVAREAMLKGMIVNIDHTSSKTRLDMQVVSNDFGGYPLNAFHNNPNRMIVGNKGDLHTAFPHEYDFDDGELDIVRDSGGFFGVRVGPLDADDNATDSGVTVNCPRTATETAKILAYLLDRHMHVGYGLDYATVTQAVWSRTLANCGRELDRNRGDGKDHFHKYGEEIAEGLSHVGMMKLFHNELETVGLKKKYLDQLRNDGPEAFIAMWERSEEKSSLGKQIPRQSGGTSSGGRNCATDGDCAKDEYCTVGIPGLTTKSCEARKTHGATCTDKRQCSSDNCLWGLCADKDECRSNADCLSAQYCGDPVLNKRTCKPLKGHGQVCTDKGQCASDRCSWGFCADADECRSNSDCNPTQYCGDPISGKASCKALHADGDACTKGEQCRSKKCSFFKCK